MNDLTVFNNERFGKIRTVVLDGVIWFVGKDIAEALGYSNPSEALADYVEEKDKGGTKCYTPGGAQEMTIINESGVYSLVFASTTNSRSIPCVSWLSSEGEVRHYDAKRPSNSGTKTRDRTAVPNHQTAGARCESMPVLRQRLR